MSRFFGQVGGALPGDIVVKHLNVYRLLAGTLFGSIWPHEPISSEVADRITLFYRLNKTVRHQKRDTKRWRHRLAKRADQFYWFFRKKLFGADMLIVWNGFALPLAAAVAAARSLGIKVVFCEHGVLPGTIAMDPKGINFANSLSGKPAQFFREIALDPAKVESVFSARLQQRPLRKPSSRASSPTDDDKLLPERYMLFAMQVHNDSQVLLFSPRFHSMEQAVTYVAEELIEYNKRTGDSLRLVVKEHPSDSGRIDYTALRQSLPDAYFLRTTPISKIIGNAQAVITINSTVGVEALLHLRPVITLGDAFYNVPGVVRHLNDKEDLAEVLVETVGRPVDRDLISRFLYSLRYEYLVPAPPKTTDRDTVSPAAQRILDILYDQLSWMSHER